MRGSEKHIRDWSSSSRLAEILRAMIKGIPVEVADDLPHIPRGMDDEEAQLHQLEEPYLPAGVGGQLTNWWLVCHRGIPKCPNWDLLVSCKIQGKRGLILFEGKAHEFELAQEEKGKELNEKTNLDNHERIGDAIEEARVALDTIVPGVGISRDRCYQLSNRVAYAWKLATMGISTVLVYLGFLGDEERRKRGKTPFSDDSHWHNFFAEHCKGVIPPTMLNRELPCGKASMWILVRSLHVDEIDNILS